MYTSSNGWKMRMLHIIMIFIVYFTSLGLCFPSSPLNEKPKPAWEAWLLVDENQSQTRHSAFNSDGTLRRRITPKSVFIAPTFSPDALPACADGYSSDSMGRCIKIIKLDEDAHYDFILSKLEDKFGSFDYEDDEDDTMEPIVQTSQGPLQLNIPFNVDRDEPKDEYRDEETDIAIVVSPTKPIFDMTLLNLNKRDRLVDEQRQEMLLKQLIVGITHDTKDITTTTFSPETTTKPTEGETYSTILDNVETTTVVDQNRTDEVSTIRNSDSTITSTEVDSLLSTTTESDHIETTTDTSLITISSTDFVETIPTDQIVTEYKLTTQSPKPVDLQNDDPLELTSAQTKLELTTASPKPEIFTRNSVRFPDQEKAFQNIDTSYVRFPDGVYSYNAQVSPTVGTRELPNFGIPSYYKQKPSDNPVVFRDNVPSSEHKIVQYSDVENVSSKPIRWEFNRRNRDKNSSAFMLPPKWDPSTFQKPLVLRFSRKHAFMDNNEFKSPAYYRSIPPDDFAYLFKFKQKRIRR